MQQRLPSLRESPLAFAHRGARAHAAENTIDAFLLALKLGANGIETDAWVTNDGHVVLDHDGVVRQGVRRRPIGSVDRSSLGPHIPSFEEMLSHIGHDVHISIDVKDINAAQGILDVVDRCGFPSDHVWLCHCEFESVLRLRDQFPQAKVVDSTRLSKIPEGPEVRAAKLAAHGIDALNMHFTDWNGGLVTMVHRFGVYAFGWDVQFPAALTTAFRMGLDGVYSDHVDRMVDAYVQEIGSVPARI